MEREMTRPWRNCLFLSSSLINLSIGLSCSETPCGRWRQDRESSGGVNDPWRALLSWHRSSACCSLVEHMLLWEAVPMCGLCFLCIWLFSVDKRVWISLLRDSLSRLEFPCFAFLLISQTYLIFLSIVFHGTPRLCATAAVLAPPKSLLQRDLEFRARPPPKAVLGSAVTCCEPPHQWCCARAFMLWAFSSQFSHSQSQTWSV